MKRREFLKGLGVVVPALVLAPSLLKGEETHDLTLQPCYPGQEPEPWPKGIGPEDFPNRLLTRAEFQKDMQQSLNKVFDDIYKTDWHRRVKKIWNS